MRFRSRPAGLPPAYARGEKCVGRFRPKYCTEVPNPKFQLRLRDPSPKMLRGYLGC